MAEYDPREIVFSSQAYCKMLMHAMKYPHSVCSGLLLSAPKHSANSNDNEDGENQRLSGGDSNRTRVIEAIPIMHASHCLTPNVEIAYNSVQIFAQEQELVISGYYQTDRYNDKPYPDSFCQRITDKICENNPDAVLCLITFQGSDPCWDPHQMTDGKWLQRLPHQYWVDSDPDILADHILFSKEKLYRKIVDFDDHLDNISLDWTNASISQRIDHLITNVC